MSARTRTSHLAPNPARRRLAPLILMIMAVIAAACGTTPVATGDPNSVVSSDVATDPVESDSVDSDPADADPGSGPSVSGTDIDQARQAVVRVFQVGDIATPSGEAIAAGTGTGFIIDPSGLAVTNNHVAGGAAILEVTVDGETEPRNARVVGLSECADLAVIDIEGGDFPFVEFYDGEIRVGTDVLAAGYPLGTTEFTLTRGIISTAQQVGDTNWASVEAVIEHDARIRGGNSGGPLFTADGFVVGVNYAGNDQHDFNAAIAAEYALPIIDTLRGGSPYESIGLNAVAYAIGEVSGLWVNAIETGSPADKAGIKPGDFVIELEGVPLATDGTLRHYCDILRSQGVTDELNIEVIRPETGEILEGNLNSGQKLEVVFSPEITGQATVAGPGTPYADFVRLIDDTGLISFQVPAAFVDVSTAPLPLDGYGTIPVIAAAENLATAFGTTTQGYSGNGAALVGFTDPGLDMEQTIIDMIGDDAVNCTQAGPVETYETNGFEGVIVLLNNCSGQQTTIVYVAARIPGEQRFIILGIQAVDDAMIDAIPTILNSFRWEQ